jgi:hypothetical protein
MFSDANINKTLSSFVLITSIAAMVILAIFRVLVPDTLNTVLGIAIGYASHSLGVTNGISAVQIATTAANGNAALVVDATQKNGGHV